MLALARTGLSVLILLALAGALVVHLMFPPFRPGVEIRASPDVSVQATRVKRAAGNPATSVALRVTAGPRDLQDLSVFWAVAPDTDDAETAPAPLYIASPKTLHRLVAGSAVDLEWPNATVVLAPGEYQVTGWVHQTLGPGQTRNLAGGRVGQMTVADAVPLDVHLFGEGFAAPLGPLALDALSIDQPSPESQQVEVQMSISNRGSQAVGGRAYWVLGRVPDSEPFRAPLWQATWRTIAPLQPGASATLEWQEAVDLPGGTYGLSAWVHMGAGTDWQHSDNSFVVPLRLGQNRSGIQRAGAPTGAVRILSATLVPPGLARLTIDNQAAAQTVAAGVDTLSERRRFDWYRTGSPAPSLAIDLPDHATQSVDIPVSFDCSEDARLARVALQPTGVVTQSSLLDDVLLDVCA